jgi:Putative transmembrane protein (PGPGW)
VPGPGIATILLGLFLLALEFERAERLLERAIVWAEAAAARAERTTTAQRITGAVLGIIAVSAFIVAAILWNIPLLPVL